MPATDPRPKPKLGGLAATVGGLIAFAGFIVLLDQLPDTGARVLGALASALVVAVGLLVLVRWAGRPARTAGVVLSGLGIVPLLVFAFTDPTSDDLGGWGLGVVDTVSAMLAVAAMAWGVGYLMGPGRRATFYLAAALVAVWAVLLLQIGVDTGGDAEDLFGNGDIFSDEPSSEDPFSEDPSSEDPFSDDPSSEDPFSEDPFSEDPFSEDDFGGDDFGEDPFDDEDLAPDPLEPFSLLGFGFDLGLERTRLGVVSLLVGLGYVSAATVLDRRRRGRPATPFAGVGDVALFAGILLIGPDVETAGAAVLAIAAGAALIAIGAASARRFTAWLGAVAVVLGAIELVSDITNDDTLVGGIVLLLLGAGVAVAANLLGGTAEPDDRGDDAPAHAPPGAPDARFDRPPDPF
ncbi:hypothetical protein BH20ACT2_BH20ACT2_25880 [soil metagenome]